RARRPLPGARRQGPARRGRLGVPEDPRILHRHAPLHGQREGVRRDPRGRQGGEALTVGTAATCEENAMSTTAWLGFAVILGILLVLVAFNYWVPRWVQEWIRWLFTWALRMRYALVLIVAPTVLGFVAFYNPYLLRGVLLAREATAGFD